MKITFIRHTAVDVETGTCYGQTNVDLKATFPQEAQAVKDKIDGEKFDRIYCSPLSRCRRLAAACGYPEPIVDDRLLELNFGQWEMKKFDEITDPQLQIWYDDFFNAVPTGGESAAMQQARVKSFIEEMKSSGLSNVCVFTHGGVILQVMLITGMCTLENLFDHQPPYGGILTVDFTSTAATQAPI
ncbi:MAG: alpha-ribazole phosphatase [Lachnoclostridium sp.]|nr:alpha-ribazole phosphatase [Lachnoclostridium sp.]